MIQPTAPLPLEVYKNTIIITDKTKMIKSPNRPIKNIGIRMISPKIAINNCNGIEDHNTKKQLTGLDNDKSRNTPFFIVKYTVKNRYKVLIKK